MATAVENGHSGTIGKDGSVGTDGSETAAGTTVPQNHPPTDDKEKPSSVKRVKTPSSTPNKKKPYRAARADESGIPPSTVNVTPEPVHNGSDISIQPHRGMSPNDNSTYNPLTSNPNHVGVMRIDDRTSKPVIERPSNSSTPERFEEVKVESKPLVYEAPELTDVASDYQEESKTVAKRSDDHRKVADEDHVLEKRSLLPETTDIRVAERLTSQIGVAMFSLGDNDAAESREKRIETEASTSQTSFKKDADIADTEHLKNEVRRKPSKTSSYWRRVTTSEEAEPVEVKTSETGKRRKETLRRFYPTKEPSVQPRFARTLYRKRSTLFYFRGKSSHARPLDIRSKRGASGRCLAVLRPSRCRWLSKAGISNTRKSTSGGSTKRLSGNSKGSVIEKKVSTSNKNSVSKINRSTEQLKLTNHLTGVQNNGGTETPETGKSGSVEVISGMAEDPCPIASDLSVNSTDVQKGEHIYRSMFDNFVEGEVSHRVDGSEDKVVSPKTESTPAEVQTTESHRRDNIFERFRSSMQSRGSTTTSAECLNLSRKKDRNDGTDQRQVSLNTSRDKDDLCDSVTEQHHANDIKELLGDYDSDSTECCKYDELDEIYSDNQTTKEAAQLGCFLAERTENFYPGFSVFNLPSDSDDNLVVDESMDSSQAVEASSDQRPAGRDPPHANSDDEDRQLKKLRNTAYRTYTRMQKQRMQQKGSGDGLATDVGARRTTSSSPPPPLPLAAADQIVHREEDDTGQGSKTLDPKVEVLDEKRRGRATKKTNNMKTTMKRRKSGIGKSQKTVPTSRHAMLMERKKANAATKKRAKVCKEFATRSKTRNKDGSSGPPQNSASSSMYPEASEITDGNNETTGKDVEALQGRGKLPDKKIRNGGCRRRQGRPPTKKALAADGETRPGRRKTTVSKSKEDFEAKDEPPKMDILSRELGPRYNWLEQKIQAMQRSCSDEGFDSRGPRPSPESQTNPTGGPSKRASNIKYESDDDCRGPEAKRWSEEDHHRSRQENHAFTDHATAKCRSEDGHVMTEDLATDSELRLTRNSGPFDDFYDPTLPSLPAPRIARGGRRMSPNLVWTVAAPSVITTTAMPLGLKLVRSSAGSAMPSPAVNSLDCSSPSALAAAATPSSLNGLNDEEGLMMISETSRPLSPSPTASPTVMYYDSRQAHSLRSISSRRESHPETEGTRNGMRSFSMAGLNCVAGSPFVPDYSLRSEASNSMPDPSNVFPGPSDLDNSDCQVPFDLSRSALRTKTPPEMELLNEHMENVAGSRNSPQEDHRLTPIQLTTTGHKQPPSERESTSTASRKEFLERELDDEGVIRGAAIQVGVEVVESGIVEGETVIDLTTDVDPVPSNSDESSLLLKPYPSQDGNELQAQPDTRSTPVLRSIKYEYVRRLEMYERLSKVSKIKDQEIAILESERKRVKKELDCLKNIFVRATAGLPQESDDRTGKAVAVEAEKVAGSSTVVESSWSPAGDTGEAGKAKEAHRRESTVRLVASQTPPDAHSVKMDLSMYTYLKCQYKQDRLKAEEEFRDAYNPDCGSRDGARDIDSDVKVLGTPPTQFAPAPASAVRSSTSDQIHPYHPARITGPYCQGSQAWIAGQSGECLNGTDSRKSGTASVVAASSSSMQASTLAESYFELDSSRPRHLPKSDVSEAVVLGSPFRDFISSQATHYPDLSRKRPQNLSEPPPRQHRVHELETASQSPRTSSYTADIETKPVLQQLVTEKPIGRTRRSPPATNDVYSSKEQQATLGSVYPEHDRRLRRNHETFISTDKAELDDKISVLGSDDNQYEAVDLSRNCPGRSKIASHPVEPLLGVKVAERPSARDLMDDETPLALDLKWGQKDNISKSIPFGLSPPEIIERVEVLDELPKRIEEDQKMLDYSQSRRNTTHSRIDDKNAVSGDRSLAKNQMSGESEVHGLRNTSNIPSKVPCVLADGADKRNTEPVDLKIVAVQGSTLDRDQPKVDRTEGVPSQRSGSHRPGSTQGSSEGAETDLKGHSIRNLIPDMVPQQQHRPRERVKSFDSPKVVVITDTERTAAQGEAEKPEGAASPKTYGRRTSRRWPKQQKSPQQGYYPDKYGLSSNLQDMSFMVNSISTGGAYYNSSGITGAEQPRPTNDVQAPSVESEQRPTVQTDMLNTLSPTYNARVLAQRPGYEHGEKRGPPLALYPTEPQVMMHQRPVETGTTFTNPQKRDPNGLQPPSAVDLNAIRPHIRDAVVYRADEPSATSGPPPSIHRYAELQQGVAHRGGRDDVAHLQMRPAPPLPPPPSFRPSNSPVIGHRDSAFVSLASQRRDTANARQSLDQLPQNDPSRHGNPDPYHLRQQPGIGAYSQPAPPPPAPRHGDTQMQQRFYGSGSMPQPHDSQQAPLVNRNDRIPLAVYQKSGQQQPFGQKIRQETVPRDAHPQMATHRLVTHQMDLVPSSEAGRSAYGTLMLNPRAGLDFQRGETGAMPARPEDGLMFPGQPRSDSMTISRIVMQQAQRSQASVAGFQEAGGTHGGSGPEPIGFAPHPASGIDPTRIGSWRVSQEYAVVRDGGQENQQQLQEASRKTSARHVAEQRAMGHVDQRSLGMVPVSEQMNSSRGDPSQLRPLQPHPSQLIGDRYLPSYMESIAGAPQPQQVTPYRISGLMNPPGCHPSRQPGKDDVHRLPAPQRHTEQAQAPIAINMRGDGLHLFQTRQPIFPVPPGIVSPAFGGAGNSNPTQVERIHLRPGYDMQKAQESFSAAAYPLYDRPVQLMSGRGGGPSGLAVQPTNMTSGRQQRQDDLQAHPVKTNQAPIHRGLEGYKQPPSQLQQQEQRGQQLAKPVDYVCEVCRKPAMFVCSACKGVAYCSTECQAISWQTRHSFMCRQP